MPRFASAMTTGFIVVVVAALALSVYLNGPGVGPKPASAPFPTDGSIDTLGRPLDWSQPNETPTPRTSSVMWPQASLDEVRQAQALADAGDPDYAWQVDPALSTEEWGEYLLGSGTRIVERFVREELGWDHAMLNASLGLSDDGPADGLLRGLVYLRCAPGATNLLYPIAEGFVARGADKCAPTIDDLRYETVGIDLSQPAQRGANGIWVVDQWGMTEPFAQADSRAAQATAERRLEAYLQARVDGAGAERYLIGFEGTTEFPLLYATTAGARYERFEFELVGGPHWPEAHMEYAIRLFAQGGDTVVEQGLDTNDSSGGSFGYDLWRMTENGQPVPMRFVFLDGQVVMAAPYPWTHVGDAWHYYRLAREDERGGIIEPVAQARPIGPDCSEGAEPADAEALAQAIGADPHLVTTTPVALTLDGRHALRMDITLAQLASTCEGGTSVLTHVLAEHRRGLVLAEGSRMRLYLVDAPAGSPLGILAIAIVAPESRFAGVLEYAVPIVETLEFGAP